MKRIRAEQLVLRPRPAASTRFAWLYGELRRLMGEGILGETMVLPSTRSLAAAYGVARGTVVEVYEQLEAEGYVRPRRGAGTAVAKESPDRFFLGRAGGGKASGRPAAPAYARSPFPLSASPGGPRPFAPHHGALDLFPLEIWNRVSSRSARRASIGLLAESDAAGHRPLRRAICDYLRTARGVRCSEEQVVIVSGTQFTLTGVAALLLRSGGTVWIEEPGYMGAAAAFEQAGGRLCPVPIDAQGIRVAEGIRRAPRAALAFVTPAHQFPLGVALSPGRREELLGWAARAGAYILEDDYDSEFRYRGRPLPSLQGAEGGGRVIFAGSFNKVLFPSLRLGFVVLPQPLLDPFLALRSRLDRFAPAPGQAILADFIEEGHFSRHVRRMRQIYAERREALLRSIREELAEFLTVDDVPAGVQTVAWLRGRCREQALIADAASVGLELATVSRFYRRPPRRTGFFLGFAAFTPEAIAAACRQLRGLLRRHRRAA